MRSGTILAALAACAALWSANAAAIGDDRPKEPAPNSKPESAVVATPSPSEEFVPPPGFVKKKRGSYILYCKRDTTIGTRIKTENCYDEQQVRDYMLAVKETKDSVDRIRSSCSNICVCGAPEACNPNIREPNL